MKELDAKYCQTGEKNAVLTNKANSISAPWWAKPLIMSGHLDLSRLFPTKEPLMIERFGFERHRFRYRSRPKGILPPTSNIPNPTPPVGPILTNKANLISAPRQAKPLNVSGYFDLSRLFPTKRTKGPLMVERFGFERRRRLYLYWNRPKGILPPTSKIQHPTSTLTSAIDLSLWSYVIVVSIQYEASIQSFFLRVRKEGV